MSTLVALLLSLPAHALDCAPVSLGNALPADGAVDVPLNAMPTIEVYGFDDFDDFELRLEDGNGDAVAAEVVELSAGDPVVVQFQPEAELGEDSDYTVVMEHFYPDGSPGEQGAVTFHTGVEVDLEAPEAVQVLRVDREVTLGGDWGNEYEVKVALEGGEDPSGSMFRVELSHSADFSETVERTRLEAPVRIFHGLCTFDAAAKRDADEMWVRVTPVDAAGNEGPSAVFEPTEDGQGKEGRCAYVSGAQLGWMGVVVGLIGALRRRDRD